MSPRHDYEPPPPLFRPPPPVRHNAPATSRIAARSMADAAPTIRDRVFAFVRDRGRHGSTYEEVSTALELRLPTVSARLNELSRAGRIADSGRTRQTTGRRPATVWVTPEHARPGEGREQ